MSDPGSASRACPGLDPGAGRDRLAVALATVGLVVALACALAQPGWLTVGEAGLGAAGWVYVLARAARAARQARVWAEVRRQRVAWELYQRRN